MAVLSCGPNERTEAASGTPNRVGPYEGHCGADPNYGRGGILVLWRGALSALPKAMVSISNMSAGQASSYFQKDGYYQAPEGLWAGQGAREMSLQGGIQKVDFFAIINGIQPGTLSAQEAKTLENLTKVEGKLSAEAEQIAGMADGTEKDAALGKMAEKIAAYNDSRCQFNESLGDRKIIQDAHNAHGIVSHRAGTDLTFSAPKSVSIISEVMGDQRVLEAHDRAVDSSLKYVESHFAQARQTENGQTKRIDTSNLVVAKFGHETSRELDPQLHTHCFVSNMTQRADGQWRAVSNEEFFANKILIGQVYRNELAANLKDLGFAIQSDQKGLFEVQGIDQRLLDHFSQRSTQIEAKVAELREQYPNTNDQALREMATLGSREGKKNVDMAQVRESWTERLDAQGYSKERIEAATFSAAAQNRQADKERIDPKPSEYDIVRQAAGIITENESAFRTQDLLKVAGKLGLGEYRMSTLERAAGELAADKELIGLGETVDRQGGKTQWFSTAEMQKIERQNIQMAARGISPPITSQKQARAGLDKYESARQAQNPDFKFTSGQRAAAEHILSSEGRVLGVQGDAGAGKTALLDAVRAQAERAGYQTRGLAFTGKAAAEVEAASSIKSGTIHSFQGFLAELNRNGGRGHGKQVWIVDEASMAGSRQINILIKAAEQHGAKLVLIGDTKQLQAIEQGRAFKDLQTSGAMKTANMNESIRQTDADYKQIVTDVAGKRLDLAFDRLEKKGSIKEIVDRQARLDGIVKDYTDRKNHKNTLIVTARNGDRNALNEGIREVLKSQGQLSGPEHTFKVKESKNLSGADKHFSQSYQPGDHIHTAKAGIAGRAGNELRITGVDQARHTVKAVDGKGKEHIIDVKKHGSDISAYTVQERSFSQGDKIIFTKNDKALHLKNGHTAEIKSADQHGDIAARMDNGRIVHFNIKDQYSYVDHGYAVSTYKSQGQTSQNVIYNADTQRGVNYNEFYVSATRGKEDLKIYTDSKEQLKDKAHTEQVKTSTIGWEDKGQQAGHETSRDAQGHEMKFEKSGSGLEKSGQEHGHEQGHQSQERNNEIGL